MTQMRHGNLINAFKLCLVVPASHCQAACEPQALADGQGIVECLRRCDSCCMHAACM